MGCGCGGGQDAPAAGQTAQLFAILIGSNKMGRYPSRQHAEIARRTVYQGAGQIVPL
jgi:hypothetical protein